MNESVKKGKNTLLASMLLSAWAPLATGLAAVLSNSVTQIADFIRRTVEFLVLFLSWFVFRMLQKRSDLSPEVKQKWEKTVRYSVAAALALSGLIMLSFAFFGNREQPGGNVLLGLTIAVLGFLVNVFFWRRYKRLGQEAGGAIIESQSRLYLAKLFVDLGVIAALVTVALWPLKSVTKYVDLLGSAVISLYLLWSAVRTIKEQQAAKIALDG